MSDRADRPRRSWGQRLLLALSGGLACSFLFTAVGLGYVYTKFGRLPRIEIGTVLTAAPVGDDDDAGEVSAAGAKNFLIVGVDSANGLAADDPLARSRQRIGGLRSDTTMILRVDPASSRAALLAVPRDLYVPITGTRGSQKINAAVSIGGPEMLINTVQDYFGIPINHYVQVDFAGFFDLVDALEGIPIFFPNPVRDTRSGLYVPETGCVTLDARQALAFVRSRAYQEQIDGRWRTDGTGDIGRVLRQQLFIQVAVQRAVSEGIRNPVKLDELIDTALRAVVADDRLDGDDIVELASSFRAFQPDNLDLYSLPVYGDFAGGLEVLRLQERTAEPILDIFRGLDEESLTESGVRVTVLNGSGTPGQAASARDSLRRVGFAIEGTGDAESFEIARTQVRYPAGQRLAGDLVARWVDGNVLLRESDDVDTVTLVTGADYDGLRTEPSAPTSTPSTTTTTLPRTTTTTRRSSSTAPPPTVIGTIPADAETFAACH